MRKKRYTIIGVDPGQCEAFLFDEPANDLPFGLEVERRRREEEESAKGYQSVVATIRAEIEKAAEVGHKTPTARKSTTR